MRITLEALLSSPQAAIAPRLLTVLNGYASRQDFTLTADLAASGASLSVPVIVEVGDHRTRTATVVPFELRARRRADWFPKFLGVARIQDGGPLESVLQLAGVYEVPLGALGGVVDRVVLGGAAQRSLRVFLERLREDVLEEVRRAEFDVRRQAG